MKFTLFSSVATLFLINSGHAFEIIGLKNTPNSLIAREKREITQEGGIPFTFCQDGKRRIVNKKNGARIYTCPDCTIWNWPNARDWLNSEAETYGIEVIKNEEKTEPYIVFYNINTVACLDKDADVSKYNSINDLDEKI